MTHTHVHEPIPSAPSEHSLYGASALWASLPVPVAPIAVAVGALGFCIFMALVNPATARVHLVCPFRAITGLWCPGCGMTRGLHALVRGHVEQAAGYNVLLFVVVPYVVYTYLSWVTERLNTRIKLPEVRLPVWGVYVLAGLLITFGVLRNIPVAPFRTLAP